MSSFTESVVITVGGSSNIKSLEFLRQSGELIVTYRKGQCYKASNILYEDLFDLLLYADRIGSWGTAVRTFNTKFGWNLKKVIE